MVRIIIPERQRSPLHIPDRACTSCRVTPRPLRRVFFVCASERSTAGAGSHAHQHAIKRVVAVLVRAGLIPDTWFHSRHMVSTAGFHEWGAGGCRHAAKMQQTAARFVPWLVPKVRRSTQTIRNLKSARCSKSSATELQHRATKRNRIQARQIPLKAGIQVVLSEQDWTKPNHDLTGIQSGIQQTSRW